MQVTHTSDRITHAVIGGEEKIQMKVNADAAFFHMLSDTLYSDKPMAVVREVLCNAWDAHIEAENTHTPIKVYFSEDNEFVVEDFGKGIPKDKMGDIYGTLGGSTKQKNSEVTGGFGLGCKSPSPWLIPSRWSLPTKAFGPSTASASPLLNGMVCPLLPRCSPFLAPSQV